MVRRKVSQVGGGAAAASLLKRDERMTMARGLYRKRGGGVVAAGNHDLDRQAFTGIVKERGFN
jgi:hypothetical protein